MNEKHTQHIRALVDQFQQGYIERDQAQVDAFMQLFTPECEVIGTGGQRPGVSEWYLDRDSARALVAGDWQGWGDLRLEMDTLSIHSHGDVGWIAVSATVSEHVGEETYQGFLDYLQEFTAKAPMTARQKLLYILRGGSNTLYELSRGEDFVWPLRLTAVVVRGEAGWQFAQMNFSFPTIYFPDVRRIPGEDAQWY